MTNKQGFDIRIAVALGSGLAATLLLAAVRQGTFPALFLAYLSPLPLMIATLGFGHWTGLGAVAMAVVTFVALMTATAPQQLTIDGVLTAGLGGLIFAVCEALPAWWLARLAGLSRANAALPWTAGRAEKGRAWDYYPVGLLVLTAALIGFAIVAVATVAANFSQVNFEAGIDRAAAEIAPFVVRVLGSHDLPNGVALVDLARLVVKSLPAVAASMIFLLFLMNLWLAGRVVQVSNRLTRPWPNIAHESAGAAFARRSFGRRLRPLLSRRYLRPHRQHRDSGSWRRLRAARPRSDPRPDARHKVPWRPALRPLHRAGAADALAARRLHPGRPRRSRLFFA